MKLKLFENFQKDDTFFQEVKDCFQDLIDDGDVEIMDTDDWGEYDIVLHCIMPTNEIETNSYEKFINQNKMYYNSLTLFNECIERLKQHSESTFDLDFDYYTNDDMTCSLFLQFKKGNPSRGDFYKIMNNYVCLDYDDLRKVLNLPKSTEFNIWLGSIGKRLAIYFRTEDQLDEHKDQLIENIRKLKIDGTNLITKINWYPPGFSSKDIADHKVFRNDNQEKTKYRIEFSINPKIKQIR